MQKSKVLTVMAEYTSGMMKRRNNQSGQMSHEWLSTEKKFIPFLHRFRVIRVCKRKLCVYMSHAMRLWYFSSSVNSFFKRACAAIYFMCANSESSGETAQMRRLAWAFAGHICDKYYNLMSRLNYCFRIDRLIIYLIFCENCSGQYKKTKAIYTVHIWSATWQNQQNKCAPSEDSDQPGHPPSLISVFAVRMKKALVLTVLPTKGTAKSLIILFVLSCRGSYYE